jgi:hypothetical protein
LVYGAMLRPSGAGTGRDATWAVQGVRGRADLRRNPVDDSDFE